MRSTIGDLTDIEIVDRINRALSLMTVNIASDPAGQPQYLSEFAMTSNDLLSRRAETQYEIVYPHTKSARDRTDKPDGLDKPLYAVLEDAIWQALDSEQGMPHSGVDPVYVIPEFLRLLDEAGYTITPKPGP